MITSGRVAILIFGVALLVASGSALQCWVCASNVNVMCNDPMNITDHQATFHITTCNTGRFGLKPVCRKIVKQEYGKRIVIRQCSELYQDETVDGSCSNSVMQSGYESCHICDTNLCNSATTAPTTRLLHTGALALLAYVFHQFKYCVL